MSTTLLEIPAHEDPPRKRWTRAEHEALYDSGVLDGQRWELVEGELINKMGQGRPHVNSLVLLLIWLQGVFGPRRVLQDSPIDVAPEDNPTNEPVPDLVVLNHDFSHFALENPQPSDLALVIEVSHTRLGFDLTTKASLYAKAGIADYWVLDVAGRRMIVHREPGDGRYASVLVYSSEEAVAPLAATQTFFKIGDAFPQ
jgi:Uma2 family endonuclease